MSFWSGLLNAIPVVGPAISAGLGAISHGQANNRGEKFAGQLDLQQLLMQRDQQNFQNSIAREQEGRTGASDAWRKLLSAQHTLSPAAMPNITPYAAAQRMPTDAERAGADALTQEVLKRLQGGNPIGPFQQSPMTVDPKLLNPGLFERIAGYAAPALNGFSVYMANQGPPRTLSRG